MIDESKVFFIQKAKFYLPNYPQDCISSSIVASRTYWDTKALRMIDKYLSDDAVILDIGANVGSHTLYWALERNAKKIYSFEPFNDTFSILSANIELNNLEDRVTAYNVGLSDCECRTRVALFSPINVGGTSFKKDNLGGYEFRALDSFEINEHIDLIKIDVEDAEVDVLNGAKETIKKNNPIIVLETYNHKSEVDNILHELGYEQVDTIREGEDYIYKHLD